MTFLLTRSGDDGLRDIENRQAKNRMRTLRRTTAVRLFLYSTRDNEHEVVRGKQNG